MTINISQNWADYYSTSKEWNISSAKIKQTFDEFYKIVVQHNNKNIVQIIIVPKQFVTIT